MALVHSILSPKYKSPKVPFLQSDFLLPTPPTSLKPQSLHFKNKNKPKPINSSSSSIKIIRNPSLDRHVVKNNKIRFVQKLKTLLLSKPKHYLPLQILSKCRSYLSLPPPRSLLSMIHRYPSIFEFFTLSTPHSHQLCVRLTPLASSISAQESDLKSAISTTLATKIQKLLMLSSHHRLLLSKLVHLASDLGLPPNFRSRLCNSHPNRFKTVDTSYGRALELVSWEPNLALPIPYPDLRPSGLIVDRPLKFKHLRLQKGLNLKRKHRDFLLKFGELPEVSPYLTLAGELAPDSIESEKRACGVLREVLGMMVEKRTLIDHLTHFRKEFGLPNKLRGMVVRHPELFYVSVKGQRDSVFLVEGYNDKGQLLEKDELLMAKERLIELVREGKRMRREWRKGIIVPVNGDDDYDDEDDDEDGDDDGFENLFDEEWEDYGLEDDESVKLLGGNGVPEFWGLDEAAIKAVNVEGGGSLEPW